MALVTIGIPVYNEDDYLNETINSAISQTLSDIEIIISDNASTDSSFEIANEYSNVDRRVRVFRQEENIGPLNNFRFLLDNAETPYFVWLGGHDIFLKDYIDKAVDYLEGHAETVMVYPKNADYIDFDSKHISSNACSGINTNGIEKPLKRVKTIVEKLSACTNIHGVFRTKVLRQLPFEKVIGADFLMLSMTGLYGHISDIDIVGMSRRKIREENASEVVARRENMGVFSSDEGENPYKRLTELHIHHLKMSKEVNRLDKLFNIQAIHKSLSRKFG